MRSIRLAAFSILAVGVLAAPSYAGLVLVAGPDAGISSSNSANTYGFSVTY